MILDLDSVRRCCVIAAFGGNLDKGGGRNA
jgi:hypothetical protein